MIRLVRAFDRTSAAAAGFHGKKRIDRLVDLVKMARAGKFEFDSERWKPAKAMLKVESRSKCAYCEGATGVVAHGDVEHFRPKSVYWWLAYCYDNYLFSCQICNQSYKKDFFPVAGQALAAPVLPPENAAAAQVRAAVARFIPDPVDDTAGFPRTQFVQLLEAEQALLPDPYREDPEQLFAWSADPILKEVVIIPRDPADTARFDAVTQYFGLNRDELKRWRWSVYFKLEKLRKVYVAGGLPPDLEDEVKTIIRAYLSPDEQFAAMSRYFVNEVWVLNL